jgi:hypothetical protein
VYGGAAIAAAYARLATFRRRADAVSVKPVAALLLVLALVASDGAVAARDGEPYPCDPSASVGPYGKEPPAPAETVFVMGGDLYAVVGSSQGGLLGGWSGPPVLSVEGALRWATALGVGKSLFSAREIVGGSFGDGGSESDFSFGCKATYVARAVVRRGRDPVQFGVYDDRGARPSAGFHSPELQLPLGALVELRFTHPLARTAPVLLLDRDGDGTWDRRIVLHRGGGTLGP